MIHTYLVRIYEPQPTDVYDLRAGQAVHDLSGVCDVLPLCPFYWKLLHERHLIFHLQGRSACLKTLS